MGVRAAVRRLATVLVLSSAGAGLLLGAGCAALAEEDWSWPAEAEAVELVASPSIPEAPAGSEGSAPSEARRADGCIDDMVADAVVRWPAVHRDEVVAEELSIWPLPDVDGDGREESMAIAEIHCGVTGNCPRLLYLSHRGCPRYGGGFWATWQSELVLPKAHRGVHDLEVHLTAGCAGMAGTVVRLGWTGKRYRVRSTIDCECPEGWDEDGADESEPTAEGDRHPACPS